MRLLERWTAERWSITVELSYERPIDGAQCDVVSLRERQDGQYGPRQDQWVQCLILNVTLGESGPNGGNINIVV